jgi:hypothetical protein
MELIKSMKKSFLSLSFTADEVDVINQQNIHTSIFIAEFLGPFLPNSGDKFSGKSLGTNI